MKMLIFSLLIAIGSLMISGCERADYQHPMHRK